MNVAAPASDRELVSAARSPVIVGCLLLATMVGSIAYPLSAVLVVIGYAVLLGTISGHRMSVPLPTRWLLVFSFTSGALCLINGGGVQGALKACTFGCTVLVVASALSRIHPETTVKVLFCWVPYCVAVVALVCAAIFPGSSFQVSTDGVRRLSLPIVATHPNTLAAIAAVGLLSAVTLRHSIPRRRLIAMVGASCGVLILTGSRSAIVDLIAGAAISTVLFGNFGRVTIRLVAVAGVTFALAGNLVITFIFRSQSIYQLSELSGRRPIWSVAVAEGLQNPILGSGYLSGAASVVANSSLYLSYSVSTTDNILLDAFVESGAVAFLALLLAYVSFVFGLARARICFRLVRDSTARASGLGMVVAGSMLVHGLSSGGLTRLSPLAIVLISAFSVGVLRGDKWAATCISPQSSRSVARRGSIRGIVPPASNQVGDALVET